MAVLSAHDVAAELRRRLPGLRLKKLHKLLYYCQGHHLASFDEPLFKETVSAYDRGPLVGQMWREEKEHGVRDAVNTDLSERQLNTIGYVISRYGRLSGKDLENLTHNEAPWQTADALRRQRHERRAAITPESMAEFFRCEPSDDLDDEIIPDADNLASWLNGASERTTDNPSRDNLDDIHERIEALR